MNIGEIKQPYYNAFTREYQFSSGLVMTELEYHAYMQGLKRKADEWTNQENCRRQMNAINATNLMSDMMSGTPPSIAYSRTGKRI